MMDTHDFVIIEAFTKANMEAAVIKALNLGYRLAGNMLVDHAAEVYTQPMTKRIQRTAKEK